MFTKINSNVILGADSISASKYIIAKVLIFIAIFNIFQSRFSEAYLFSDYQVVFVTVVFVFVSAFMLGRIKKLPYFVFIVLVPFLMTLFNYVFVVDNAQLLSSLLNFSLAVLFLLFLYGLVVRNNLEYYFARCYIYIMLFFVIVAFLQFLGVVELDTRSYLTSGTSEARTSGLVRVTSFFDEPSAFAFFLIPALLLSFVYRFKCLFLLFAFSILMTMSLIGYVGLIASIVVLASRLRFILVLLVLFIMFFLLLYFNFLGLGILLELVLFRVENSQFGGYRVQAPLILINECFGNLYNFFFGFGVGQIKSHLLNYSLEEYANTSHNLLVDLFFEMGAVGASLFIFSIFLFFKIRLSALKFVAVFVLLGFGWRSMSLPLILVLIHVLECRSSRGVT